jgi:prepilin-type N-terminal cleavage/methylation domain-containing protein
MLRTNRKGVTLVELLIVVLILAALSTIAIPRISQSAAKAKAESCSTNISIINSAIEQYNMDNNSWPATLTDVTQNTTYFPGGEPTCGVTDATYPTALTAENRLDETGHSH